MTGSVGCIDDQPPARSSFIIASILREEPMIVEQAPEVRKKKPEDSESQEILETQRTAEKAQGQDSEGQEILVTPKEAMEQDSEGHETLESQTIAGKSQGHEILEEEKFDDSEGQKIPQEAMEQDSEGQVIQDEVMDESEELKASEEHFKWFGKHYDDTGKTGLDILADVVHQIDLEVPEVEIPTGYSLHSANRKDKTISARKAWGNLSKVRRKEWDSKANEMFDEEWKLGKVRKVKKEAKGKKKKVMRGQYMNI